MTIAICTTAAIFFVFGLFIGWTASIVFFKKVVNSENDFTGI